MSASSHSRSGSQASQCTTSSGSSYQVILDHILSYPGSYDIPLRRMYELNLAPRAPGTPPSAQGSPVNPSFPWAAADHQTRATQFAMSLSQQIAQLPSSPASLPPSFVTSFVRKCFPYELSLVDFPHALAALDYLKDLEMRRRRELATSLRQLGINETTLETTDVTEEAMQRDPRIAEWIKCLEAKERRVDQLYTHCYVALRRWIMINEMSLTPFNKHNCLAMLNTLYPPVMAASPTRKLTLAHIKSQRDGFFKYVQTVEKRGVTVLDNLMNQGKRDGDENGWPAVHRFVMQYLTLANSMIAECEDINSIEFETRPRPPTTLYGPPRGRSSETEKRSGRKVDSGVDFNSGRKHSKSSSTSSTRSFSSSNQNNPLGKGGSTLERLAREFRKMRPRQRLEVDEIIAPSVQSNEDAEYESSSPPTSRPRGLRKLRSFGALGDLKIAGSSSAKSSGGLASAGLPPYDADEMRRQRAAFENRARSDA